MLCTCQLWLNSCFIQFQVEDDFTADYRLVYMQDASRATLPRRCVSTTLIIIVIVVVCVCRQQQATEMEEVAWL